MTVTVISREHRALLYISGIIVDNIDSVKMKGFGTSKDFLKKQRGHIVVKLMIITCFSNNTSVL